MIGLYKFTHDDGFIEPSVWLKYTQDAPLNVDFNFRYQIGQNFWMGLGGSTAQAMHIEGGILLGENLGFDNTLKVGYGYDYSFSSYGPYTGATHEINITYAFGNY